MAETETPLIKPPRRWHFEWLLPVLLKPRTTFRKIGSQSGALWQTPILILIIAALLEVAATGMVRKIQAATGQIEYPQGFEYYTPEQQAQYTQAMQSTTGPAFLFVLPALVSAAKVLAGWLLVGGLLHLLLTLLGGRGDTRAVMNLVAWAGLPFALRSLVRAVGIFLSKQSIAANGLSGFIAQDGGNGSLFLAALLSLIDIYLIWHIVLLLVGVRATNGLSWTKVLTGVLSTLLLVVGLQALLNFGLSKLSALTIIRPFF